MKEHPNIIAIDAPSLAELLVQRDARDRLRHDLEPAVTAINEKLAAGWTLRRIDYVIFTEDEGLKFLLDMAPPSEGADPATGAGGDG